MKSDNDLISASLKIHGHLRLMAVKGGKGNAELWAAAFFYF
jgi:hypothetical protein